MYTTGAENSVFNLSIAALLKVIEIKITPGRNSPPSFTTTDADSDRD
jgi:hypothetical protein